jgi:hypothetical protein
VRHRSVVLIGALILAGCGAARPVPELPSGQADVSSSPDHTSSSPSASTAPKTAAPPQVPTTRPSPTPDRWLAAGELNDFRVVTHLALLGTGHVLVVGADNVCGVTSEGSDTAEIGDPAVGSWHMTARLPSRRQGSALVALADGRALVTAGMNGESEGAIAKSSTVIYDPAGHRWSSSGLLNTARVGSVAAVLPDGRVLVAGGLYLDEGHDGGRALASAELWDPTTGDWSRADPLSGPRLGAAGVILTDGSVLVVGGLPSWGAAVERTTAESFDPVSGRWSAAGKLAAPRSGFSLVALGDGGALVVGGMVTRTRTDDGETWHARETTATVERFDPVSRSWSKTMDLMGRPDGATGVTMADGRALVVTGTTTEIYDPVAGAWTATTPIPNGRNDASAILLPDASILVAGGWSRWPNPEETPSCPVADVQVLRFVPGS